MAKGDTGDIVQRLVAAMPPWFPDLVNAPVLNAVLTAIGDAFAFVFSYLQFAKLQTRITTSTGGWLDLTAWDYFGPRFLRRRAESDAFFMPRIKSEILRPRQTREAIQRVLLDLTGRNPVVFEAYNPYDCGGYDVGTLAYDAAGYYGELSPKNTIFVTAYRPPGAGIPVVSGYGGYGGGYDTVGAFSYIDMSQVSGPVTDAEIYQRVAETAAAGVTPWTAIKD